MIPEELLERFRTLSLERIGRVEGMWNSLLQDPDADETARQISRDVHTLKGDSAIVGFAEVRLLCQKLEDLLSITSQLQYQVPEDLELVVTMAIQFVGMLLRTKRGAALTGLDLPGFMRQVDDVLRECRALPEAARGRARRTGPIARGPDPLPDRLSEGTRQRLAAAATSVFLEYLSARGTTSRARLRGVWHALKQELVRMQASELRPLLEYHARAAAELAATVGKRLTLQLDLGGARVDPRVADAVDIAALHVMRNAVDHGIEDPEARAAQGKAPAGLLRVRVREGAGVIGIEIEDDGRGIDLEAVRRRGIERGLLDPARAHAATDAELAELVFQPGLSTRTAITDLSGRGVGMDAVRSALARVGGAVRVGSRGGGCIVSIEVAAPARHLPVYQFLAPGGAVALAVSARWTPALEPTPRPDSIDPLHAIRLFGSSRQTAEHPPSPLRELGLRLRWGFLEVSLRAATEPRLVTGERICPTPEEHPIEVIAIDGREVLLLRPEHIADPAAAWPDRSATA